MKFDGEHKIEHITPVQLDISSNLFLYFVIVNDMLLSLTNTYS